MSKYRYSQVDKSNMKWFDNDMTNATLSEILLIEGKLRGLCAFQIEFKYPISVIAGENRSGKSTILAMVACAFHNASNGFKLPERKIPYYTFSDFFIQSSEEIPPDGILILYRIRHNRWRKSSRNPDGVGNLFQRREKKKGGKWNNYNRRVKRNVVFLGVQRVVPPSEKSVSKSYKSYFIDKAQEGWENDVKEIVGRILGINYDEFRMKTHSKYRLPIVRKGEMVYSGFNMGAGECTLFEIFSIVYASPSGTLLVIDEIELGLHEKAQKIFIKELKRICKDRHIQLVCTTHSSAVLDAVPPEGRFFVENYSGETVIRQGISPEYAAGKLSGEKSDELDIYVEDKLSQSLVEAILNGETRKRVQIVPIGSPNAIIHQMVARFKDRKRAECIAIMDGDQSKKNSSHISNFLKALENIPSPIEENREWFESRLLYLPGETWPEKWILEKLKSCELDKLADDFGVLKRKLYSSIDEAISAGKHYELHNLSKGLSLDEDYMSCAIFRFLVRILPGEFESIEYCINNFLE